MLFVNLTPHTLNIHTPEGVREIAPSGDVARVSSSSRRTGHINNIPVYSVTFGKVTGLPDPVEGTVLIVSGMVATVHPRKDVFSPGELIRDGSGRPIGCNGLKSSV